MVQGRGAADGYIAGRFARRAGGLALLGGAAGAVLALPLLGSLSHLAAPFAGGHVAPPDLPRAPVADASGTAAWLRTLLPDMLPWPLLAALPALPLGACLIGWLTAHGTVRIWLRRLP